MSKTLEWILGLGATVLVGGGGWLFLKVDDIRMGLTEQKAKLDRNSEILAAIQQELPSVRVKIARTELHRKLAGALITTQPQRTDAGWVAAIHVFDNKQKKVDSYTVPLTGPNDQSLEVIVSGVLAIRRDATDPLTVADAKRFAETSNVDVPMPDFVTDFGSYGLRKDGEEIETLLKKQLVNAKPSGSKTIGPITSWTALAKELTTNKSRYASGSSPL